MQAHCESCMIHSRRKDPDVRPSFYIRPGIYFTFQDSNSPSVHGFTCASLNTSAWLQWHRLLYFVTVSARSIGDLLRYQFFTARRRDRPNLTFCLLALNWHSNCNSWNSVVVISQSSCSWLFTACLTFISSVACPVSCVVQNATAPIRTFILATFPDLASFTRAFITSTPLPATNRSLSTWMISSSISHLITTARFRQLRSSSNAIADLSGIPCQNWTNAKFTDARYSMIAKIPIIPKKYSFIYQNTTL